MSAPAPDPAEHHLDLAWARLRTRVRVVCCCGWSGRAWSPEAEGSVAALVEEGSTHLGVPP